MWSGNVGSPVWYEPPTIATCAAPFVHDTSRKTGAPVGNVPSLATCETTPFTEIATDGAAAVVVVVVVVVVGGVGGTGAEGVVVVGVVVDGGTILAGAVFAAAGGTSAPGRSAVVGGVVAVESVEGGCAVLTWG